MFSIYIRLVVNKPSFSECFLEAGGFHTYLFFYRALLLAVISNCTDLDRGASEC
jgi:hypothetical protein